jgi:hypothetical protein
MYSSREWSLLYSLPLARASLANRVLPLNDIERVLTFEQGKASLAYAESFAAFTWLVEQQGEPRVGRLLRLLASVPFDEALERVTGSNTASFEQNWFGDARASYAFVGLADDVWIWSIVLPTLFFLALGVRWWRNRQTLKRWKDEDDDDTPDEPLDERIADTY